MLKQKKLEDFLVRMDIEKSFDSLDYNFLICNLAKYGFGNTFDPISAFFICFSFRNLIFLMKSKPDIEAMTIFEYNCLYSAYANNATFFLIR